MSKEIKHVWRVLNPDGQELWRIYTDTDSDVQAYIALVRQAPCTHRYLRLEYADTIEYETGIFETTEETK